MALLVRFLRNFSSRWAVAWRARYLLPRGAMAEWKPLHEEAESLVRIREELATRDDELAALRNEMTVLDGLPRRRLTFIVTTGSLLFLSSMGIAFWLIGGAP